MLKSHLELENSVKHALSYAKQFGADAAEVAISCDSGFSVTARAGDVENLEHEHSTDFSVTVYYKNRTGTVSSTDISETAIAAAAEKACDIAKFAEADEFAGLADKSDLAFKYPDLDLYHPWEITPRAAIDKAIEVERYALSLDKRLQQSEGVTISTFNSVEAYGNSHGFIGSFADSSHDLSLSMIAKTKQGMERDYAYTSARNPEQLEDFNVVAERAVANTLQRLDAVKIATCECPVLFIPRLAKRLWGALIGAISGPNIYRQMSFLHDQLGKQVLPEFVTVGQQPHLLAAMGSSPYDNDGVLTRDLNYVENGQLVNYVLGSYSARKLDLKTTGNAGGVFNLMVTHGDDDFSALLKQMGKGLVVIEVLGQGVNIVNGNYSRGAVGLWVEQGEIQHAVHEITIAGNLKDMFKGIVAVGNDIDTRGTIRTGSVLIDRMTVGGK